MAPFLIFRQSEFPGNGDTSPTHPTGLAASAAIRQAAANRSIACSSSWATRCANFSTVACPEPVEGDMPVIPAGEKSSPRKSNPRLILPTNVLSGVLLAASAECRVISAE